MKDLTRYRPARRAVLPIFALCLLLISGMSCAVAESTAPDEPSDEHAAPGLQQFPDDINPPGITIDRVNRTVDVEAVVLEKRDWLELLACTAGTRDHESVLAVNAVPSHIHVALLLIGLEPGKPFDWKKVNGTFEPVPPIGPAVAITMVYEQDGQTIEVPANLLIKNQVTGETLDENVWLFTGSILYEAEGVARYVADTSGTVASIVNFRDDLLARDTTRTRDNDEQEWGINEAHVPPAGTKVIMRLQPVEVEAEAESQPAD